MDWRTYDTLFRGVHDRRVRTVLAVVTRPADVGRFCAGTLVLLSRAGAQVDLIAVTSSAVDTTHERSPAVRSTEQFRRPSLRLGDEASALRDALVGRIRDRRPDVVICPDPTPVLRQHPDDRVVAGCAFDAAWPYAAATDVEPSAGAPHQPSEAWLYAGPAPDLFVTLTDDICAELRGTLGVDARPEETFTQVDLRVR